MKFVADEGVDASLVKLLRDDGHDVIYFAEADMSTSDDIILSLANDQLRVLITRDKDFGELVHRMRMVHSGVILVRLENLKSLTRAKVVFDFITNHSDELLGTFIVIQSGAARIRKL